MFQEIKKAQKYRKRFIESVKKFGTPQYVLVVDELKERINIINQIKKYYPNIDIYYTYKANCRPFICKLLHESDIHASVSSIFELKLALKLKAKKIIYNGPGKTREELNLAILNSDKVIINVDSFEELKEIIKISKIKNKKVSIGLRVCIKTNHDVKSNYDVKWSRFGIRREEISYILSIIKKEKNISFEGFHFHIGIKNRSPSLYKKSLKEIGKIIRALNDEEKKKIKFINIGGGFGVEGYFPRSNRNGFVAEMINKFYAFKYNYPMYKTVPIEIFIKAVIDSFKKDILSIKNIDNPKMILEPGRWFVSPCVHLLTKVIYKKGEHYAILDSSITMCSALLYEYHPISNLNNISYEMKKCNLLGSSLFHIDILGKNYYGNRLKINDILCIMSMGAYMENVSWQFCKPLPKIIALSNGTMKKIKKEEDFNYRFGRDIF